MSKKKIYSWSRPYPVDAQAFGEWVEKLPDSNPETVIAAARDPQSVAHKLFEWDSSKAARNFRLVQARLLFGSLVVDVIVYRRDKPETHRVRAIMRSSKFGDYESVDAVMSTPTKRDFVLAQALAQLSAFKRRYNSLSELALVFAAVDEVESKTKRRGQARRGQAA